MVAAALASASIFWAIWALFSARLADRNRSASAIFSGNQSGIMESRSSLFAASFTFSES